MEARRVSVKQKLNSVAINLPCVSVVKVAAARN